MATQRQKMKNCTRLLLVSVTVLSLKLNASAQYYSRQYGSPGTDEIGKVLLPERDNLNNTTGNIFIGGNASGQTLIMKVNQFGQILGQWKFKVGDPGENEELADLRYDRTLTSLIGTGYIPVSGGVFRPYVFRFSLATHTLTWASRFSNTAIFASIIDRGAVASNGTPIIHAFGMMYSGLYAANYFEINLNTGAVIPSSDKVFVASNSLSEHYATEYDYSTGKFFSTGRWGTENTGPSFRPSLFKSNGDGSPIFNRTHLVPANGDSRLYSADIVIDNGGIPSVLTWGDFTGGNTTTNTQFAIARFNPNTGSTTWSSKFNVTSGLPGPGEIAHSMLINGAGNYVVYGYSTVNNAGQPQQLFLTEITPSGAVLWGKTYPAPQFPRSSIGWRSSNELVMLNNSYYLLSAAINGTQRDIQLIRTDLNGDIPGCSSATITIMPTAIAANQAMAWVPNSSINTGALRLPVTTLATVPHLLACPNVPLAASDLDLNATKRGADIELAWDTQEDDVHEFVLSEGTDPDALAPIATFNAKEHSYLRIGIDNRTYYYLVQAIRNDGTVFASEIKRIDASEQYAIRLASTVIQLGEDIKINMDGPANSTAPIRLFDLGGRTLMQTTVSLDASGAATYEWNSASLSSGIYYLSANGSTTKLFIH